MNNFKRGIYKLVTFLVLCFGLTIAVVLIMYATRQPNLVILTMWSPAFSAFITNGIFQRSLRGMGWRWGQTRWQVASYFLPIAYCTVAYGLVWLTGLGQLNTGYELKLAPLVGIVIPVNLVTFALLGSVISAVSAAGEEIGWRGFLS